MKKQLNGLKKKLNRDAFNPWVYDIIDDYTHRLEVYYGGAGSGKSYGALQKMLLKALRSKRKVLVIRKVGATLRDSVFALTRKLLADSGRLPHARINASGNRIELSNGSVFLFKGLDDPEKIKSIAGITDIVIEEATELTLDDFCQLNLRLRPSEPFAQIFLIFNPVSKASWVYNAFFRSTPADALVIHTTYHDNRFLTGSYKNELERLKDVNPAYYRIYALGEFATLDKLVFPRVTRRLILPEETANLPFWCGLDFGYVNDPSALTWGRYDRENKRIFSLGEYHKKGMTNEDIIKTVHALGLKKELIVCDSSEPKSIDELCRAGLRVKAARKGPDSVMSGLDFMLRHELIVDERCVYTFEEYENYTWQKDRQSGEYKNCPIDAFNHHIDSTRYGLERFLNDNTLEVLK